MQRYFQRHAQVFFYSLGQLARSPVASLMTIAVIGIALALPTGLYVLVDNLQRVSGPWDNSARISAFLKKSVPESRAREVLKQVGAISNVQDVEYISADEALDEFKRLSEFGSLIGTGENPLPGVLLILPTAQGAQEDALQALVTRLKRLPEVDTVQLDLQWVRRLQALLAIAQRTAILLGIVLAMAVVLITGNTIRLEVLNGRDEIEVIKLVGGTNAFVRRPFLYSGAIQGFLGAFGAWMLIELTRITVAGPATNLAQLYGSGFQLEGLELQAVSLLLLTGSSLGWLGSRIAVWRPIREIAPS